jgi:hypothetical protein
LTYIQETLWLTMGIYLRQIPTPIIERFKYLYLKHQFLLTLL